MRRTPLKRRRTRTRPRPSKNRELYDSYIYSNPWSEWCYWTGWTISAKGNPEKRGCGIRIPAKVRHHLWSYGMRVDCVGNIISMTDHEHRWAHRHLTASRVISIFVKLKKRELDLSESEWFSGKKIDGWLGTLSFQGELAWVEPLRIDAFIMAQEIREGME